MNTEIGRNIRYVKLNGSMTYNLNTLTFVCEFENGPWRPYHSLQNVPTKYSQVNLT